MRKKILSLVAGALCALHAADAVVKLPEPNKMGGMPLMEALANRKSARAFNSEADIQPDVLGDLLWATWGFNRPGMRTAPTAINLQEFDLYVLKQDGCWLYDAEKHALVRTVAKDLRKATLGKLRPSRLSMSRIRRRLPLLATRTSARWTRVFSRRMPTSTAPRRGSRPLSVPASRPLLPRRWN